eukprot:s1966_g7.t1
MNVSRARFRKAGFQTAFSPPVAKHTRDAGLFRGRASGTCLVSHLRLKPYPAALSSVAEHSSRVVESLVDIGDGTNMYVASLYGPTHTTTFFDPWALLSAVCKETFDHALSFKGPAMIMGDFNVELDEVPRWSALKRAGWTDAAELDACRRGVAPSFTSKDKVRKSFILINAQLTQALTWCDTIEEYEFDAHPLLAADFDVETILRPVTKWWLPVSTDRYMFDPDLMEEQAIALLDERKEKFDQALAVGDGEEALRQVNLVFESCLQQSCVDSTGQSVRLPKRCVGRGVKSIRRNVRPSAPVIPPARNGHFTPCLCQPSLTIRYQTKQVRRLQSLESQLLACERNGLNGPNDSCQRLWCAVCDAKGFHPSFTNFVLRVFGIFVPTSCPGAEYVHYLVEVLKAHVQKETAEVAKQQRFQRECKVLKDVQSGGPNAYRSVRDPSAPPFNAIEREVDVPIVHQRWPKEGRDCVKLAHSCDSFDFQYPVYFQGQECFVIGMDGLKVQLDRKVKWKDASDMRLIQKQVIADRHEMQKMTGAISGVSADIMAASLLLEVEKAVLSNHPRMGLTVDIIKCFNAIPRKPILAAMSKLGVPWQVIKALDSMFTQLQRVLELSGEIGVLWSSTTGVPEGCAMSIISMLSLSVWVAEHVRVRVNSNALTCMTYADNWALVTDEYTQLQTGVDALTCLVGSLQMKIAADKSWTWATHTKQRAQLSDLTLNGTPIPQKLVATELGCDVSYSRKVTKTSTKKRLAKTSRVLKRVSTKKLPKKFKTTMTQQLSSGIAGYGSELVHHSVSDLRLVRTAVCRAIGRSRAGNNPYLSTFLTPGLEDVSVTMLLRKVMFWRRYFRIFPDASPGFLANLCNGRHMNGASAFLRRTFHDHGWKCGDDGFLEHTRGWKINWLRNSKAHLRKMFLLSWNLQVCEHVQHRTNFDAEMVDVPAFHQAMTQLDDNAKTDIMNLAAGKHVTNNALVHYSKGAKDDTCPFCNKKDSREHRVWTCVGTKKFRDKYPAVMQWLSAQPKLVAEFGILPFDVSWIDWRYDGPTCIPTFPCPDDDGSPHVDIFTDGSTIGQGLAGHSIAAAAYIRCEGYKVLSKKAEALPGTDHSAFRAEVWGLVMALRDHRRVHVFTDCASVVDNLLWIFQAKRVGLRPRFSDHEDMWNLVWTLLQDRHVDDVRVTKVKAHQVLIHVSGEKERWMAVMNDKADKLAKSFLKRFWNDCYADLCDSIQARQHNIAMLHSFHVMWREINEEALRKCSKETANTSETMPSFHVQLNHDNLVGVPCVVAQDAIDKCPYNPVFAQRVVRYFHNLQWDFEAPSISCLEMYIDFCLWTGTVAPCLLHIGARNARGPIRSYVLPDQSPQADAVQSSLREQSRVWSKVLCWLRENCPNAPEKPVRGCTSLLKVGYYQQHYGLAGHPVLRTGRRASKNKAPKSAPRKELIWFRDSCEEHLSRASGSSGSSASMTVEELMGQLLETLDRGGEDADQNALIDFLGFEAFEFVGQLIDRRKGILEDWMDLKRQASEIISKQAAPSKPQQRGTSFGPRISVMSESEKRNAKQSKKAASRENRPTGESAHFAALQLLATLTEEPTEMEIKKPLAKPASENKNKNVHQSSLSGMGLKLVLPEGTERKTMKGYERVDVPAAPPFDPEKGKVSYVNIKDLPQWAQVSFKGTEKLNTIQSIVFNAAFGRSQNLLICAPTGAGKTNIAVLTILRLIGQHMDAAGGLGRDFKVVYMAPMKALVGEVSEKFQQRLGPLGVNVAEFTGDMNLSKKELEQVHVIVTVPEKWDVMTRNTACGGGQSDDSLQKLVQLIIIDEVHLLNDERGAVIETVVARSLRFQETSGQPVRIVALSATLPNYQDVAAFLRVEGENLFYFDSSYRPIPLETSFLGITETNRVKQMAKLNEICYEAVIEQVRKGHQVMVFVHSRGDTFKTADTLAQMAIDQNHTGHFDMSTHMQYGYFQQQVQKSRNRQVQMIFDKGFGIHHAGMLRSDRTLTEKMFLAGVVPVLCCTATLAWGVNLPARSVIIKGTSIFDSQAGGYKDLGILDVQQIFGRAGRPGFDTQGHATLITEHAKLNNYLRLLLHQMPIESRFLENMANALNAEIAMGNVSGEKDAADWLRYSYLFVRFFRTPQKFGITQQDFETDPTLEKKRREFVHEAATKLCNARLIRIDNNRNYNPTDLGRVAARFYVDWETAESFSKGLVQEMSDDRILALFGKAHEFSQLKSREDEQAELGTLMEDPQVCPVRVLGGTDNVYGKVAILLQVYLSRRYIDGFSLVSDCNYVLQNASRLFRALFEITMTRVTNMSEMSDRLLEWCKMIDQRLWQSQHVLRHFCYPPGSANSNKGGKSLDEGPKGGVLKEQIVKKLEDANFDYWTILNMTVSELTNITGSKDWGRAVDKYMRRVPNLTLDAKIQPITSTIMRITLTIKPDFDWSDRWSGPSEPFWVWVENPESQDILHSEYYVLHKRNLQDSGQLSFAIPLTEPRPPQYVISVVSDRWVGVKFAHEFSVQHLLLPDRQQAHTSLLDLTPIPVSSLHNPNFERLYKFTHFNAIQTQVFHTCYHTDYNVLLGAPTGSGKTNVAELTMFRLFNNTPDEKAMTCESVKSQHDRKP